jgi:hypothetical protein
VIPPSDVQGSQHASTSNWRPMRSWRMSSPGDPAAAYGSCFQDTRALRYGPLNGGGAPRGAIT